jgi:hypothetical protein
MLTVALGAFSATAGSAQVRPMQAVVPFNFQIKGEKLASGLYTLQFTGGSSRLLVISKAGAPAQMFQTFNTNDPRQDGSMRLVFNRYHDRYFLSQLFGGNPVGRELQQSATEREARVELGRPVTTVVVARDLNLKQ